MRCVLYSSQVLVRGMVDKPHDIPPCATKPLKRPDKGWVQTFGDALHRRMFVFIPRKGQDPPRAQDSSWQQVHERARPNFQADGRGNPRSMFNQSKSSATTRCTACRR